MADISKINVNETTYDIKDSNARNDIRIVSARTSTNASDIKDLKSTFNSAIKKDKGLFASYTTLTQAVPAPVVGDYAIVSDSEDVESFDIYYCAEDGIWVNSGRKWRSEVEAHFHSGEEVFELEIEDKPTMETTKLPNGFALSNTMMGSLQKNNLILDWNEVIEKDNYYLSAPDLFDAATQDEVYNPFIGRYLSVHPVGAPFTHNLFFHIPFSYNKDLTISFWHKHDNYSANQNYFSLMCMQSVSFGNDALVPCGIINFVLPQKTDLGQYGMRSEEVVKTIIDGGGSFDIALFANVRQSYISDFTEEPYGSLEALVDGYIEDGDSLWWHITLRTLDLYRCYSLSLGYYSTGKAWALNEDLSFGNVNVFSGDTELQSYNVAQERSDVNARAYKVQDVESQEDYDNEIIDQFEGGGSNYSMLTDFSGWKQNAIKYWHYVSSDYALEQVEKEILNPYDNSKTLHLKGFKYTNNGNAIPFFVNTAQHNNIFWVHTQTLDTSKKYTMQLWLDLDELNGNGISRSIQIGFVRVGLPLQEGMEWGQTQTQQGYKYVKEQVYIELVAKYKNMVCFRFYNVETYGLRLSLLSQSGEEVKSFTIYNPTLVEGERKVINPFSCYQSLSQKTHSNLRAKNILLIGDSQYNSGIVVSELAHRFGANVYDGHYGGHAMRYTNVGSINSISRSWFYQLDYRKLLLNIPNVDAYVLTCSSNDCGGGGTIGFESIQEVWDSYPTYEDFGTDNETSKLQVYNKMTDAQRKEIFTFAPTYCAYIKQMIQANPCAKFYVCSVPISCNGYLTGSSVASDITPSGVMGVWKDGENADTARAGLEAKWEAQRDQTIEIAQRYGAKFVDFKNIVGLSYENFPYHCTDGTHWYEDIAQNISKELNEEIR